MNALEGPIRLRIQDELDKIDVEKLIDEKIPDIEEKARVLQSTTPVNETLDKEQDVDVDLVTETSQKLPEEEDIDDIIASED